MSYRARAVLVAVIVACWVTSPSLVRSQGSRRSPGRELFSGRDVIRGEVLVRLQPTAQIAALAQQADAEETESVGSGTWRRVRSRSRDVQSLIGMLARRGDVLEVEPNYVLQGTLVPNDAGFPSMWGLSNPTRPGVDIHAVDAWNITTGSAATVIGVVDSGAQYDHPDLAGNMWSAPSQFTVTVGGRQLTCPAGSHGFDAIAFTCDPRDDNGHGTHTAGTVGASGNNGSGVVGVNWTTRIMALRFLDASNSGSTSDAINAIDFAIQTKAAFAATKSANVRVLSNSYGGAGYSSAFASAVQRAANADILFVAAAGNSGSNNDATPFYPASFTQSNVVAVAATDDSDNRAGFSNYGATSVDLGAPGVSILSTVPTNSYAYYSGTSMATPHVAGAAALVLAGCTQSVAQLKATLMNTVDQVSGLSGLTFTGGRLNVDRALRSCVTYPAVTLATPTPGAGYTAPATISLEANASDSDGIARVEFYQGTTLIGATTTAPFGGSWSGVASGTYTLTAKAFDAFGLSSTSAPVSVTVTAAVDGPRVNVAAAANGGVATASSTYGTGYGASGAINGDRRGLSWGGGGGWNDSTGSQWPDWIEVAFNGSKSIDEVDVFSVQDAFQSPVEPTASMTFTQYGLIDFAVQYWDGAQWLPVPGGTVTGNTLVWRKLTFAPVTTNKIRLWVSNAGAVWTRVAEIEAYSGGSGATSAPSVQLTSPATGSTVAVQTVQTLSATATDSDGIARVEFFANGTLVGTDLSAPYSVSWAPSAAGIYTLQATAYDTGNASATSSPATVTVTGGGSAPRVNVAAAANGGVATGSSVYGAGYAASGAINGDRRGQNWGSDGGWNDGTGSQWPDWLEVAFSGTQTIDEVDVFGVQDGYQIPAEPTAAMTFTQYGLIDFVVQYWDGTQWMAVPGGTVTGNTLVWRKLTFAPLATSRIRLWISNAGNVWSRVAEIEAYAGGGSSSAPSVQLVSPTDGSSVAVQTAQTMTATATDSDGIARVEFFANGTLVATDSVAPYSASWIPTTTGSYTLRATAFDSGNNSANSAPVTVTVVAASAPRVNVASASNGGVASASSTYGVGYGASGVINGERRGASWGNGGGWNDATGSQWPDWIEVAFSSTKAIDEIDVFGVQDTYLAPVEPTPSMTFTQYGLIDFVVQYWDGSQWLTIPGGTITGNTLVWRQLTFAPVSTSKIRVWISNAGTVWSRVAEIEAYGAP